SRSGDSRWTEVQKLTASDGLAGDEFGYRVDLSRNTLVVGAFSATVNGVVSQGAAYVFTRSTNTWSENQKLVASDGGLFDNFGASVALDRDTALVGAYGATVDGHTGQGAAYIFTNSGGTLTQTQKLTANDGESNANFGNAVALDNQQALIGADVSTVGDHTSA